MKKHLLLFLFLMGFVISPQIFAAEEVVHTLTFNSTNNSGKISSYTATWKATADGHTWNIANFNNNNNGWQYVKCGRKGNASVAYFATAEPFAEAISSVEITIDAITASNVNNIYLQISPTSDFGSAEKIAITKVKGAQKVAIPTPTANQYYKITFDCASGSANGFVQVSKVTLYANKGEENPDQVAAPTFSVSEGWIAEGTGVELACATEGASIYFTLDGTEPTAESTLYAAAVAITENTTIKAIAVKDDTTSEISSASYKIIPTNSAAQPITVSQAIALIADGIDKTIEFYVAGTISKITEVSTQYGNATYIITDGEESMTVYRGYYLNGEKFTAADQIAVDDKVVVLGGIFDYNGTKEIGSGNKLISIERPVDERKDPSLKFESDTYSIEKDEMAEVAELGLSAAEGFDLDNVTWTSSDVNILHIEDGMMLALASGTVTVTASYPGDEDAWKASEATISVTVTDPNATVTLGKVTITANGVELTEEELEKGITVTKGSKIGFACETEGALLTLAEEYGATENYEVTDQPLPYEFVINEEAWFTYLITHPESKDSVEGELVVSIKKEDSSELLIDVTPEVPTKNSAYCDTEWTGKTTGIIYTGGQICDQQGYFQARQSKSSYIANKEENTKYSIKNIAAEFYSGNTGSFLVYGNTTPYTEYSATPAGTKLGTLSNTSTSLDITGDYKYFILIPNGTPIIKYTKISFAWISGEDISETAPDVPEVTGREMGETHLVITGAPGTTIYYKSEEWIRTTNVIAKAIASETPNVDLSEYTMNPDTENPHILRLPKSEHPNRVISYLAVSKSGLQSPVSLHGINADGTTTGINDIEADNAAETEWYNLQGVRVTNPANGLYIRRQGTTVEKVMVK